MHYEITKQRNNALLCVGNHSKCVWPWRAASTQGPAVYMDHTRGQRSPPARSPLPPGPAPAAQTSLGSGWALGGWGCPAKSTQCTKYIVHVSCQSHWALRGWGCPAKSTQYTKYMYLASHTEHWGVECVLPMSTQYTQYRYMYPASHTEQWGVEEVLPDQHSTCTRILPIRLSTGGCGGGGGGGSGGRVSCQHQHNTLITCTSILLVRLSTGMTGGNRGGGGTRGGCPANVNTVGTVHVQASCQSGYF